MYRHHLEKLVRTRLDDVLVDESVLDRPRLEEAQAEQDQTGKLLSDVLIDSGTIDEWDLAKLLAAHYSLPFVDAKLYSIPAPVLELLALDWCRRQSILPIDQFGKTIGLVCVEVPSAEVIQQVVERTGCTPFLYVAVRRSIREVIDETVKRRGGRTEPASSIVGRTVAGTASAASSLNSSILSAAATMASPAARSPGASMVSAAAPAASAAPAAEPPLPPLDLPRVSLRLNASAANVSASQGGAGAAATPKKPQIERFGRPAPSVGGPAAAPAAAPAHPAAASVVAKVSPMQHLLGKSAAAPAPAAPAASRDDAAKPRIGQRSGAPVLPSAPPPKTPGPGQTGWESIFDMGEDAVRRSDSGNPRKSHV